MDYMAYLEMINQAVQNTGAAAQQYVAADTMFTKDDKKRLEELKRREELGTLGYTEDEKQRIMRNMLAPQQARERDRATEQAALLSAGDQGAAASFASNLVQADAADKARAQASEQYSTAQQAERQVQKDEKVFLQDAKAAETAAKLNALFSFAMNSSETGTQTAQQLQMNQAMRQGQLSQDARAAGAGAALTTQQNIEADDLALYQF
jgi:hypothetical protein